MSLVQSWGTERPRDLREETELDLLYSMPEKDFRELVFACLRAGHVDGLRNLLVVRPSLISEPLYGFEGADAKGIINAPSNRVYTFTDQKRDGFFTPLHVAAEGGNKLLTMLLLQAGADKGALDYRGHTALEVATAKAVHAFYEMDGLKFESQERYEGAKDKAGRRTRQGTLYFKAEGYHEQEHILYSGSWKEGMYDGNGTLYYPGTQTVCYVGRFKAGKRHGRGVEMDRQGRKIYSGGFRDDQREGRGEEYDPEFGSEDSAVSATTTDAITLTRLNSIAEHSEPTLIYKGEFWRGEKHGFGVRYLPAGHKYIGRFDYGTMCGIGIYMHANGDRFEGMFVGNKLDGPGSMYTYDPTTGQEEAKHAMFTAGLRQKELSTPFVPKVIDLPVDHLADKLAGMGLTVDEDSTKSSKRTKIDEMFHSKSSAHDWKKRLGKYLRLKASEAREFKLISKTEKLGEGEASASDESGSDEDGEVDTEWADEQNAMDDITGYHFVDIPGLFVAYAYVCAAAKVLESKEVTRQLHKIPDFEEVYHLVIDAVDTYNDAWENEYRKSILGIQNSKPGDKSSREEHPDDVSPRDNVSAKKHVYMSASEIKDEVLEKQRQELALKQGDLHLDPAVEQELGTHAMDNLKRELSILMELCQADGDEKMISSPGHVDSSSIKENDVSELVDRQPNALTPDRSKIISPSRAGDATSSCAVSFASKIGPHEKNGFAAELLEIITTATSFFNN